MTSAAVEICRLVRGTAPNDAAGQRFAEHRDAAMAACRAALAEAVRMRRTIGAAWALAGLLFAAIALASALPAPAPALPAGVQIPTASRLGTPAPACEDLPDIAAEPTC